MKNEKEATSIVRQPKGIIKIQAGLGKGKGKDIH